MANERIHMNTQGGSRLRQATAVKGKTEVGTQPHTLWAVGKLLGPSTLILYQMSSWLESCLWRLLPQHLHSAHLPTVKTNIAMQAIPDRLPSNSLDADGKNQSN